VRQPPLPYSSLPTPGLHDSLQYHFFLGGGLFLALRVFHTASLQSTTAWLHEPGLGTVELVNTYTPLAADRAAPGLFLEGEEITIADGGDGSVAIDLRPTSASAIAALRRAQVGDGASTGRPELRLRANEGHAFGWIPAGADGSSDGPVIHRPQMTARVASWRGEEVSGYGYSKRYYAIYPRHNGWRFIHGVSGPHLSGVVDSGAGSGAAPVAPSPDSPTPPSIVWTADATFGDHKYNYFKLLAPEGHGSGQLRESAQADTYQQQDAAYGVIGGERVTASLREIATWHTILGGGGGGAMEMKYENRLCAFTLQVGDRPPTTGLAYNERCFGCLW